MRKFTILGPVDRRAVVCTAVFRDAVDGRLPGVEYLGVDALFRGSRLLASALTSHKLKRRLAKSRPLRLLLGPARAWALRRARRVTLRRIRGIDAANPPCFIFCPSTHIERISPEMLDDLRAKCPGCRLVFYLVDSVDRTALVNQARPEDVLRLLDRFDAAFTYDKSDAARYAPHLRFIEIPLWRAPMEAPAELEAELYFCGRNKKRAGLLLDIHHRLMGAGLRSHMRFAGAGAVALEPEPGIELGDWVPYDATVSEILPANCILEVLAEHNNESTLRYKEAVLYNKKLLTNNPNIESLPYYDSRWMRVFQSAEDIDLDWLRAVEPVDYGYRGDYSLETFLRRVEELVP